VSARINNQKGFTIPELIIAVTLIGIISVSLIAVFSNYLVIITRNNTLVDMTVNSQNLLRSTVEELRYGAGVRQTNSISDPNGPGGGWNTSNASFVIIIAVPATNSSNDYIIDTATGQPYNNEFVYFKEGTTLYKRTLAHPGAIGNKLVSSCPESTAGSTCPVDRKLADNVKDMDFTLYDQDNALTTNTLLARSVRIDLELEKDTFGEPQQLNNSIRVTLRNNFL
jgi:prepilin-type N-terminal cleavage/methylation domain-containing protein